MGTAKEAMDLVRKVSAAPEGAKNVKLLTDMQNLLSMMDDLRDVIIDLREGNQDLRDELQELKSTLKKQAEFKAEHGLLWRDGNDSAYCPDCWENDKHVVTMHMKSIRGAKHYTCGRCGMEKMVGKPGPPPGPITLGRGNRL